MEINRAILDGSYFFPVVGLKVTQRCKMNCGFCCEKNVNYQEFNIEDYYRILDSLSSAKVKRICFTGGEPLLYNGISDLIIYASKLGLETILLSADPDLLENLCIPAQFITSIRISVHGFKSTHDCIVGRFGIFDKLDTTIDNLIGKGYTVNIATVVTPENINEITMLSDWCIEKKINIFYIFNLLSSGKGKEYIQNNGRISDASFRDLVFQLMQNDKIVVKSHPYNKNAECIIVYGNGDVVIDPCFSEDTYQLCIGNIFITSPSDVFSKFRNNDTLWNDYIRRYSNSTVRK